MALLPNQDDVTFRSDIVGWSASTMGKLESPLTTTTTGGGTINTQPFATLLSAGGTAGDKAQLVGPYFPSNADGMSKIGAEFTFRPNYPSGGSLSHDLEVGFFRDTDAPEAGAGTYFDITAAELRGPSLTEPVPTTIGRQNLTHVAIVTDYDNDETSCYVSTVGYEGTVSVGESNQAPLGLTASSVSDGTSNVPDSLQVSHMKTWLIP